MRKKALTLLCIPFLLLILFAVSKFLTPSAFAACNEAQLLGYGRDFFQEYPVAPGQPFTATWSVKNTGDCAWDSSYVVAYGTGKVMHLANQQPITTAQPGETVDISIQLVAPLEEGAHAARWVFVKLPNISFGPRLPVSIRVVPPATASAFIAARQTAEATISATAVASPAESTTLTPQPATDETASANSTATAVAQSELEQATLAANLTATANAQSNVDAQATAQANANATATASALAARQAAADAKGTADAHANETAQANARATEEANSASNPVVTANANATATAQKNVDAIATANAAATASAAANSTTGAVANATATAVASDPIPQTVRPVRDFLVENPVACLGPLAILLALLVAYILFTLLRPKRKIESDKTILPPPALETAHLTGDALIEPLLVRDSTMLGRGANMDSKFKEDAPGLATVDLEHARIIKRNKRWLIQDGIEPQRQSEKGIFVNGKRTRANYLRDGDKIRLGEVELEFRDPPQGAKA